MKYLVMECHLSYAIVLDEEGRFLKVANQRFEVGQTVTNVFLMEGIPEPAPVEKTIKFNKKIISVFATMAACLALLVSALMMQNISQPYASVYLTINPEVRIDVNQQDTVVGLEGMNADGETLLQGYSYEDKALNPVMDELVDRAIKMGYLSAGGQITLNLDGETIEWEEQKSADLNQHLTEYLSEKISVVIEIKQTHAIDPEAATTTTTTSTNVVIPVTPSGDSGYSDSGYGDSGYVESDSSDSSYSNSNYEFVPEESDSGYSDSAYEIDDVSNYEDSMDEGDD